jgi:GNAT superfamily N-acetyltransferase
MPAELLIRPIAQEDAAQWRPLWDGYNAFYGREGTTALPEAITESTWARFFDAAEPVQAHVAVFQGHVVGLVHFLFHRSTTRLGDVCYLQDLFTEPGLRGKGIGRALIESVESAARKQGCTRLYWHTQASNHAGRLLYDQMAQHTGFIVYSRDLAVG